jgi:PadR family transcriptional regulator PadR
MQIETELMRGAGPVAVLKLLERHEMYGYELVEALAKRSDGILKLGQSTLYPMLYNLEAKSLIQGYEQTAPSGRVRRYYRLTDRGRRELAGKTRQWHALTQAMQALGILETPAAGKAVTA